MVELVHERVAPADDVAGRPPEAHERVLGLGDEDAAEARALGYVKLVQPLEVERERARVAVHLPHVRIDAAAREPRGLERADRPVLELDRGDERVVDAVALDERAHLGRDRGDLADEVAREVDDVRAEVAERAGARHTAVEAPVEAAHVHDARILRGAPHRERLVGVEAERLLAEHVLAGLRSGDRRLGVHDVRAAVVVKLDPLVGDLLAPVGDGGAPAVAPRRLLRGLAVPPGERDELGHERRLELPERPERARGRLPHEGVAEHADPDRAGHAAVASDVSVSGSKKCRRRVSTATSTVSPTRTAARGSNVAMNDAPCSSATSGACSRISPPVAAATPAVFGASASTKKCASRLEPSASTRSMCARKVANESPFTTRASRTSSGRMPTTTLPAAGRAPLRGIVWLPSFSVEPVTLARARFIGGEPMKPATKRFAGV